MNKTEVCTYINRFIETVVVPKHKKKENIEKKIQMRYRELEKKMHDMVNSHMFDEEKVH